MNNEEKQYSRIEKSKFYKIGYFTGRVLIGARNSLNKIFPTKDRGTYYQEVQEERMKKSKLKNLGDKLKN